MIEKITIMDTTLRDGEQSVGASMNAAEKLRVAIQLEKLGVDIMEVGFPAASPGEFKAVAKVAAKITKAQVMGLARANKNDIDAAWGALRHAAHPRLHTFISTSDIHMRYKLKMSPEEVLQAAVEAVRYGKKYFKHVQIGLEDASRSNRDFLCRVFAAVIDAGVDCINFADTVGFMLPSEFEELLLYVTKNTPNMHRTVLGVHCHDDLGLATANTLAGIRAGARHVEVTINGIGERAGNTPLEEIAMVLHTRAAKLKYSTNLHTQQIYPTSRLVSTITGIPVQPNKAVVGANAFAHESGIHQHGMLENSLTYEIMRPETIGLHSGKLVLGKHSGKHGLQAKLQEMGYDLSGDDLTLVFKHFKKLADQKKYLDNEDLDIIITEALMRSSETYIVNDFHLINEKEGGATVQIALSMQGRTAEMTLTGNSPISTVFQAIADLTETTAEVVGFSANALCDGKDAHVESSVRLTDGRHTVLGRATNTDVIHAFADAYVNGLNRLEYLRENPILHTGRKFIEREFHAEV
jgi:2-isopropylmalate synthase